MWIHRVLPTYMIKWISTFEKNEEYLSNIKALNGFLDVSSGGGILATIALRISIIPIPSYSSRKVTSLCSNMYMYVCVCVLYMCVCVCVCVCVYVKS